MTRAVPTIYVAHEGRDSMSTCLDTAFAYCEENGIEKVIIFTATGDGPMYAMENLLSQPQHEHRKVIAITPPAGKPYVDNPATPESQSRPPVKAGILNPARRDLLQNAGVTIHSCHLPFRPIQLSGQSQAGELLTSAYGVFGGGIAFCIQAVLMACDAGEVNVGERVCAVSADSALVALASRTETFLSPTEGLLVEHIICRPAMFNISKHTHRFKDELWRNPQTPGSMAPGDRAAQRALPEPGDVESEPPAKPEPS